MGDNRKKVETFVTSRKDTFILFPQEEEEEEESSEDDEGKVGAHSLPRSGSPTPCNSPKSLRQPSSDPRPHDDHQLSSSSPSAASTLRSSTLTRAQVEAMVSQFARNPPGGAAVAAGSAVLPPSQQQQQQMASLYREKYHEPRLVYPIMKKSGDLGVRLVGGNAVGIFIHSVDMDSPAYNIGLRSADQILEYNGTDLRWDKKEVASSVGDPNPQDPHVFGSSRIQ